MKLLFYFLCSILCLNALAADHSRWNELLAKHVNANGTIAYTSFTKSDKELLADYLERMRNDLPDDSWSLNEQLAYWINVYNAVTVQLILDHYPVNSIQDLHPLFKIPGLNTVWHKTYFFQDQEKFSLDEIEHEILRKKFNEPRIHFAINCASKSCPPLRNEAYTANQIQNQLQEQAETFINNENFNIIDSQRLQLSRIFSWFKSDFTKQGTLIDYVNRFSKQEVKEQAVVDFLPYDWSLNE